MSIAVSDSARAVPHSRIRELAEIAMTMDNVLKLYFGESNLPTPDFIKRAADKALRDGFTYYTSNAGLLSTRTALANYYQRLQGVALDPASEIVVTNSGVQALHVAIRCTINPGDDALVLTPAWPNACAILKMYGCNPIELAQPLQNNRYTVDIAQLETAITPKTRLLVYTSPSNPLGWVATREEKRALLDFARKHNLWLLADEVYERLVYNGETAVPSILQQATRDDAVIVAQSFSKAWCMTGWRLGWLIARKDLAARATQLNEFVISCAPSFVQRTGETALEWGDESVASLVAMLKGNRDFCLDALRQMKGVSVPDPEGAFYLFPKIEGLADSFNFCKRLLLETSVGLAPGVAFGAGGEGRVRLCYAVERPILEQAMERLSRFL
ncbi:MAG: aminotransferase class I/II-fold pyridoxal phosphate-dependent enzyme [Acidobacteria bacterium]|nr:aminotransferase class I/II-fold pyridoxal phosphate-dependent enzyme [Acidobacteriota bacterium]